MGKDQKIIYEENKRLKQENERLQAENNYLRKMLMEQGKFLDNYLEDSGELDATVNLFNYQIDQYSSSDQKIRLFLSLFRGRPDVYAKYWENKNKGKAGYSPVCANEWIKGVCQKPKVSCSNCRNQNFYSFDKQAAEAHLTGRIIAGVYPLLPDDTCYFLAIDLDQRSWQEDVVQIRQVCKENGIPFAVERSRSGNGAHVWFFFDDAIPAVLARKLGSSLITEVMTRHYQIGLDSYDRLFPNQDTIPEGGFGNLIALPLQKSACQEENSVFIDENFVPYIDQWAFLSKVEKITGEQVEKYIKQIGGKNELGELIKDDFEDQQYEYKPWEVEPAKHVLTNMPSSIEITVANMLYIPKHDLTAKALNQIIRLAAFKNPEFYKRQAMRLSTHNYPRIIHLEEDFAEYIALPRGCMDDLLKFFREQKVKAQVIDKTNPGQKIEVEFSGELTVGQQEAGEALLNYTNGVLAATTAFGKTVIGVWLIGQKRTNTLILVHRRQLLDQWKAQVNKLLNFKEGFSVENKFSKGQGSKSEFVGEVASGKERRSGIVDVALIQSLQNKTNEGNEVKPFLRDYGMVIMDECHHLSAVSYEKVIKNVHARNIYGLTATPTRKDGHHPVVFMHLGPVRYKVDPRSQASQRPFEHVVVPRFTSFKMPPCENGSKWHIQQVYSALATSKNRNNMIVQDVISERDQDRTLLILTDRTAHVEQLVNMLQAQNIETISLTGKMTDKHRNEVMKTLKEGGRGNTPVLVATGKYIGEGFDYSRLDTLLLVSPVAWHGTVQQYIGRLHRLHQDKKEVRVLDYVDVHEYVLEKMYKKRLKAYKAAGYTIKVANSEGEEVDVLYNQENFWELYLQDVAGACNQVIIASPLLDKKGVQKVIEIIKHVLQRGVEVTVITRQVSDYKEKYRMRVQRIIEDLQDANIRVILQDKMQQKFTVIDYNIVWYGSINFLGYNKDENVMRLQNRDLAVDIVESYQADDYLKTYRIT